ESPVQENLHAGFGGGSVETSTNLWENTEWPHGRIGLFPGEETRHAPTLQARGMACTPPGYRRKPGEGARTPGVAPPVNLQCPFGALGQWHQGDPHFSD